MENEVLIDGIKYTWGGDSHRDGTVDINVSDPGGHVGTLSINDNFETAWYTLLGDEPESVGYYPVSELDTDGLIGFLVAQLP